MSEAAGSIDPEVAAEFPELRLHELTLAARSGPQPAGAARAAAACSRTASAAPQAVALRRQPVPWAYRVFFRHIGLDPDVAPHAGRGARARAAEDAAASARARLLDDALTIAVMETGVPVWALDADRVEGELGLRPAQRGERFGEGEYASDIPAGRLWWPTTPGRSACCSARSRPAAA